MGEKRITSAMLKVLEIVAGEGATAAQVAEKLGIRISAARKHLEKLELYGLIRHVFVRKGVGRPSKVYTITEDGIEVLPKIYGDLLVEIVDRLSALGLRDKVGDVVEKIAIDMALKSRAEDIRRSVERLNSLGFMSSVEMNGDRIEIVSRNCPVFKVAKKHFDIFCTKLHTRVITLFTNGGRVELAECMVKGSRFCRHILVPSTS